MTVGETGGQCVAHDHAYKVRGEKDSTCLCQATRLMTCATAHNPSNTPNYSKERTACVSGKGGIRDDNSSIRGDQGSIRGSLSSMRGGKYAKHLLGGQAGAEQPSKLRAQETAAACHVTIHQPGCFHLHPNHKTVGLKGVLTPCMQDLRPSINTHMASNLVSIILRDFQLLKD